MQQQQGPPQQQMHVQQQFVSQQPGVTVITQNAPADNDDKFKPQALSQMKVLSVMQIVMGAACFLFGIILIGLAVGGSGWYTNYAWTAYFSNGIYIGGYYLIVGGIGLGAVQKNNYCWIVAAMVLNIICSAVFWLPMVTMASIGLGVTDNEGSCYFGFGNCHDAHSNTFMAMHSLMLIMAFVEFVVTIWSAALCCGAVCSCCKTQQVGHVVQYNARPVVQAQHQVMMYPSVPMTTTYAYPMGSQQVSVQTNMFQPAGVHQQPTGYMSAPQGPPSYYASNPTQPTQPGDTTDLT